MLKGGEVVLTNVQFTDTFEIKLRPAVVLFEEMGNVVVAGITSNAKMAGIPLTTEEGAVKDSVIKLNYIFWISSFRGWMSFAIFGTKKNCMKLLTNFHGDLQKRFLHFQKNLVKVVEVPFLKSLKTKHSSYFYNLK